MSYDSKKTEDEWFVRHEREMLEGLKRERLRREQEMAELMKQEEAKKKKDLHWMKCPKCGSDLAEQKIQDVIIDKCTFCEGVFLDRYELDELMMKHDKDQQSFLGRVMGMFSSKEPAVPSRTNVELTRAAIRTRRQEVVAQALELTEEESEKFWPIYKQYRAEVDNLNEEQTEAILNFVKGYEDISQAQAADLQDHMLKIAKANLELKEKYVQKFRGVLSPKKVARYFHIEYKLDAIRNYDLAETVPLIE